MVTEKQVVENSISKTLKKKKKCRTDKKIYKIKIKKGLSK